MGRYTQTFELSTNLAMFYTRCYMLAHLTRNDKHKDCALAYNDCGVCSVACGGYLP